MSIFINIADEKHRRYLFFFISYAKRPKYDANASCRGQRPYDSDVRKNRDERTHPVFPIQLRVALMRSNSFARRNTSTPTIFKHQGKTKRGLPERKNCSLAGTIWQALSCRVSMSWYDETGSESLAEPYGAHGANRAHRARSKASTETFPCAVVGNAAVGLAS